MPVWLFTIGDLCI